MTKISTKPPSGMRDFLPGDVARREYVVSVVRDVYQRYGFVPLETPAIENLEILLGNYGEDEKLIYRLLHRGEALQRALGNADVGEAELADQALRYDLTVPLARVVARHGQLPAYFKRYQIQPVWRADRPGKGRYREFYQCDVDVIGTRSLLAEAEVCAAVAEVFSRLGFEDFAIHINHRQLLRAMVRAAGIPPELAGQAFVAIDKLDKLGSDGVAKELRDRGIADAAADELLAMALPEASSSADDPLDPLRSRLESDEDLAAVAQVSELLGLLAQTPAQGRCIFDGSLARGLGYYTGTIFEVRSTSLGASLAGGGRYDGLIGVFGKRDIPAVGFSIGLERVLYVMEEHGMYPPLQSGPQIMLCWLDVDPSVVLSTAHAMRGQGLRVEIYPDVAKLGRQLQYADSEGVKAPFCAIVGADEAASGEITIKRLATGEQRRVALNAIAATVSELGADDE